MGTAEKGLVSLDKRKPDHTFKFRNAMVSLGHEKGNLKSSKETIWKVKAISLEKKKDADDPS